VARSHLLAACYLLRQQRGPNKNRQKSTESSNIGSRCCRQSLAEKAQTILEVMARLDMNDEKIAERVASPEYQSLLRKAFREWAGAESEEKRKLVRNILAHARSRCQHH
jgi:hypothetical protein